MASKSPAFRFYAVDFLNGTNFLSNEDVGAYIRLLAQSWDIGPLPTDLEKLAQLMHTDLLSAQRIWGHVSDKFHETARGLINRRLELERSKQKQFSKKQSGKALKSWEKRRQPAYAAALPRHSHGIATAMPKKAMPSVSASVSVVASSEDQDRTDSSALAQTPAAKPPDDSPIFLTFPTVGKEREWALTQAFVSELQTLYPVLDVFDECRRAKAWCLTNRANRKTAAGMPRFLNTWLSKSTDRRLVRSDQALTKGQRNSQAVDEAFDRLRVVYDEAPDTTERSGAVTSRTQMARSGPPSQRGR